MSMSTTLFPQYSYPEGKTLDIHVQVNRPGTTFDLKITRVDLVGKDIFVLFELMMENTLPFYFFNGIRKTEISVKIPHELDESEVKIHRYFLENLPGKNLPIFNIILDKMIEFIDPEDNKDVIIIDNNARYLEALNQK